MSFLTLDLNLLRVFDAVMTEQNLTRAAGHLAMTQPAVSNAIKRLRESLGDDLLIRTAYGVKPTPRAEALWPAVRGALASLEAAVAPGTFDVSRAHATFRMAMADATAAFWLPSLMRSIEREAPGVNVRMVPLTTREPRPMLLRGDIDLAVGFFPGVAAQLMSEPSSPIRHERLYSGTYVCVMRRDHPLAKGDLTLDSYCATNHLLVSFSGRAHGLVDEALAQIGRERRILLTVNQFFTAGRVVANSDLVTVLPKHLIASTGMTDALISKELPFQLPAVHLDMLWHERDARSPVHKWLRSHLESMNSVTQRTAPGTAPKNDTY
ncbi:MULTISPECIES: LysR family transcriptional regulator [unclassified Massilia]|uniref:LysR family transcriptional regulator n=1 Tax=unclassified Massilia TaxID=2609279 RepID=UPI00067BA1B3|nr:MULTISPECIES: LysR family transcriptional regulator [unclassified Massilia]AKU23242.1 LysR family transcriptional regulator [Massilia sp. NR 4-1]UMR31850.1 LysR family transcriptional regulator [Massilia sp. MB5]UTY57170.1 LysR family transcriptional regulator [Massilia sp. erpn]